MQQAYLVRLREILATRFDIEELRTLCFDLGVGYDDLRGEGRSARARELVDYMARRKRVNELITEVKKLRPDVVCNLEDTGAPPISPRPDNERVSPKDTHVAVRDIPRPSSPVSPLDPVPLPTIEPLPLVQCSHLRTLLDEEQWHQADQETLQVLLTITGRQKDGWLRAKDIAQMPCVVPQQIDLLWREASDNRFGWSAQLKIWHAVAGRRERMTSEDVGVLGDHVGWRVDGQWRQNYRELQFSLDAPVGHLPSLRSSRFDQTDGWLETWKDCLKHFLWHMNMCL